jgi:SAM-dependent methyltransferase
VEGFGASTYGDGFAEVYDHWYPDVTDTAACVERLVELAGPASKVLELGIGTGRIALPLAERGLVVTGIDASAEMLARLADKPGADAIEVVLGDMADLDEALGRPAPGGDGFALAFAAYNTLFNLPSAGAQRACVQAVGARLAPGGRLVVEGFVPADDPTARRDDVAVSRIGADELVLSATLHDREAQTITGQHVQITEAGVRLRPWRVRYLLPAQLDEIAGSAGLHPEHRWSDWVRSPFDDTSPVHVSVYRRAP